MTNTMNYSAAPKTPSIKAKPMPFIGVIGQGWVGRHYANHFEGHGYLTVRYSLEPEFVGNAKTISGCDFVFIAVPTPTKYGSPGDISAVRAVLPLVGRGKVAVIKSTVMVGVTKRLQEEFKHCTILHCPEFLSERTAAKDVAEPPRNIIGLPVKDDAHTEAASALRWILPEAPCDITCSSDESELIKYAHNANGYLQVVFTNLLFDVATECGASWDVLQRAFSADPDMSHRYLNPVHQGGRGAGGDCFIKDFEAFIHLAETAGLSDGYIAILKAARKRNLSLLVETGKSVDLVQKTYGGFIPLD
jgi:nucleotide sugar dehydrogenase